MSSLLKPSDFSLSQEKFDYNNNNNEAPLYIEDKVKIEDANRNVYPINFVRTGSGRNAVLLMPGVMGFTEYAFQPQIDALPKMLDNYTIVAWDPPGYGKSRPPVRTFPPGYYHRDAYLANSLMRKLGFDTYSVMGWCDGGTTALLMASHYPDVIDNLIIFGTTAYISPGDAEFLESTRDVSTWPPIMLNQMVAMYGYDYVMHLWMSWLDNIRLSCNAQGEKVLRNELEQISAPTLILHGANDPFLSADHIPYLRKHIKSTEYYELADTSHSMHLHKPDEFNKVVSDFLLRHTKTK